MAKFNEQLSPISANPFIKPGVQDNSLSTLAKSAFEIGGAAYTGYETAKLQKQFTGIADEYFDGVEADKVVTKSAEEYTALKLGEEELLLQGIPTPDEQIKYISGMESKLKTYQSAVEQGRMSIGELQTRILSTTREAINRNPFLERELLHTADKYMELSGLGSYIKEQEKLQKQSSDWQQQMIKATYDKAEGLNIPVDRFADPSNEVRRLQPLIAQRSMQKQASDELALADKQRTVIGKEKAIQWIKTSGYDALSGGLLNFQTQAVALLKDAKSPQDMNFALSQMRTLAELQKNSIKSLAALNEIAGEQVYKDFYQSYDDSFKAILDNFDVTMTGEKGVKYIENSIKMAQGVQEYTLSGQFNIPALKLGAQIASLIPPGLQQQWAVQHPNEVNSLLGSVANIIQGVITPTTQDLVTKKLEKGQTGYSSVVGAMASDPNLQVNLPNLLEKGTKQLAEAKDPAQKLSAYEAVFDAINSQEKLAIDNTSKEAIRTFISNYMNSNLGMPSLRAIMSSPEMEGEVLMDYTPDGHITFSGPRGAAFTNKFGHRFNMALDAYAKTYGISPKEALPRFMNDFMQERWEARTPDEVMKLVDEGRISEKEAITILTDMAKNKQKVSEVPVEPIPTDPTFESPQPIDTSPNFSSPEPIPKITSKKREITIKGAGDIYPPEKKVSPEVAKRNSDLVAKQRDFIKQAEREIVGEGVLDAPLKHLQNQEAIVKRADSLSRAYAAGKEPDLFVAQGKDRMMATPKAKWVVYSESENMIRFYSPVEKIYVDVPIREVPQLELMFKKPRAEWKHYGK